MKVEPRLHVELMERRNDLKAAKLSATAVLRLDMLNETSLFQRAAVIDRNGKPVMTRLRSRCRAKIGRRIQNSIASLHAKEVLFCLAQFRRREGVILYCRVRIDERKQHSVHKAGDVLSHLFQAFHVGWRNDGNAHDAIAAAFGEGIQDMPVRSFAANRIMRLLGAVNADRERRRFEAPYHTGAVRRQNRVCTALVSMLQE